MNKRVKKRAKRRGLKFFRFWLSNRIGPVKGVEARARGPEMKRDTLGTKIGDGLREDYFYELERSVLGEVVKKLGKVSRGRVGGERGDKWSMA